MMRKKGQITMESLLLYGAAILVVLLAIAALTYFGVLDLGKFLPEKCNLESTGIFTCEEWLVDSDDVPTTDDTISIVVKNKGTKTVVISDATFDGGDTGYVSGDFCTVTALALEILPGKTGTIAIDTCSIQLDEGDRIKGQIILEHKFKPGSLDMTTTGELTATIS